MKKSQKFLFVYQKKLKVFPKICHIAVNLCQTVAYPVC